jgi:hypothetical protein
MSAINAIGPYKHHGMWVFGDPRVGLNQKPFVAAADAMIDRVVAGIPNAEHGFTLIFVATRFPSHAGRTTRSPLRLRRRLARAPSEVRRRVAIDSSRFVFA